MQTFGLTLQISLTAIVPKQFLDEARSEGKAAVEAGQPLFLKAMQERFPDDDDQYMLAIVKNALRTNTRLGLIEFLTKSGVGGRVSPVQIVSESITQGAAAVGEYIAAQDAPAQVGAVKAVQLRIDSDTPGALVQGLVEDRAE